MWDPTRQADSQPSWPGAHQSPLWLLGEKKLPYVLCRQELGARNSRAWHLPWKGKRKGISLPLAVESWKLLSWRLLCPWDFPGKSTGVGCHFLLQGIFLTQGSNPGLLHCRQMLYPLSHQGNPSQAQLSNFEWIRMKSKQFFEVKELGAVLGANLSPPDAFGSKVSQFMESVKCWAMN